MCERRSLAAHASFCPVRDNCVAPGLKETSLAHSANPDQVAKLIEITPLKRIGQPDEMASVVRFLLSEESNFITGQTIASCGGRI